MKNLKVLLIFMISYLPLMVFSQGSSSDLCLEAITRSGQNFYETQMKSNALYAVQVTTAGNENYDIHPKGFNTDWEALLEKSNNVFTESSGFIPIVDGEHLDLLVKNMINNGSFGAKANITIYQLKPNFKCSTLKSILKVDFNNAIFALTALTAKDWKSKISLNIPFLQILPTDYLTSPEVIKLYREALLISHLHSTYGVIFNSFKFTDNIPGEMILQAREVTINTANFEIVNTNKTIDWTKKTRGSGEVIGDYNLEHKFNFKQRDLNENERGILTSLNSQYDLAKPYFICPTISTRSIFDICYVDPIAPLKLSNVNLVVPNKWVNSYIKPIAIENKLPYLEQNGITGDFNGDGIMDYAGLTNVGTTFVYYNGSEYKQINQSNNSNGFDADVKDKIFAGDFNGDGMDDLLYAKSNGKVVYFYANGNGFGEANVVNWNTIFSYKLYQAGQGWIVRNEKTGKDELIYRAEGNKFASYAEGYGNSLTLKEASLWLDSFGPDTRMGFGKRYATDKYPSFYTVYDDKSIKIFDTKLDADGRINVDYVHHDTSNLYDIGYASTLDGTNHKKQSNYYIDQNGDGIGDFVTLTGGYGEYFTVYYGPNFTDRFAFATGNNHFDWNLFSRWQDVNQDGKDDLVTLYDTEYRVFLSNGYKNMNSYFAVPAGNKKGEEGSLWAPYMGMSKTKDNFTSLTRCQAKWDMVNTSFISFNNSNFVSNGISPRSLSNAISTSSLNNANNVLEFGKWKVVYDNFTVNPAYHFDEHADRISDWKGKIDDVFLTGNFVPNKPQLLLAINNDTKQNELIEFNTTSINQLDTYKAVRLKRNVQNKLANVVTYNNNNIYKVIDRNSDGIQEVVVFVPNSNIHYVLEANELGVWRQVSKNISWYNNRISDKFYSGDFDGDGHFNEYMILSPTTKLAMMFRINSDGSSICLWHNSYSGNIGNFSINDFVSNVNTEVHKMNGPTTGLMGITGSGRLVGIYYANWQWNAKFNLQTVAKEDGSLINFSQNTFKRITNFSSSKGSFPLLFDTNGFVYGFKVQSDGTYLAINTNPSNRFEHGFADADKIGVINPQPIKENALLGFTFKDGKLNAARMFRFKTTSVSNFKNSDEEVLKAIEIKEDYIKPFIFPNPLTNGSELKINNGLEIINIVELYDITGKILKVINFNSLKNEVNVELPILKSGIYFIRINNKTNFKLLIE
ncbi:T9SS type A sorting domain-containing protein [Flavobacterium branchiophilum]|uniref:Secretion system C-terminal sorting domain-containing protein n=1 Tax=Flavobacterium branchiophilum TaxID=55197 RepID=A0A2H3KQJ9_9FLAO|nr:T9SS type A sorting domain-containing protein [Flavobacterium branchiophilum]PDS23945.1 hypothetical protein B0A77_09490 [Flavobacterium branchiophilum]